MTKPPGPDFGEPSESSVEVLAQVQAEQTQGRPPMSTAAVTGFVLAFLAPPIGVLVSLYGIAATKARQARGRGLAIAGTVIGLVATIAMVLAALHGWEQYQRKVRADELSQAPSMRLPTGPVKTGPDGKPETAATPNSASSFTAEEKEKYAPFIAEMRGMNIPGMNRVSDEELVSKGLELCVATSFGLDISGEVKKRAPMVSGEDIDRMINTTKEKLCTVA